MRSLVLPLFSKGKRMITLFREGESPKNLIYFGFLLLSIIFLFLKVHLVVNNWQFFVESFSKIPAGVLLVLENKEDNQTEAEESLLIDLKDNKKDNKKDNYLEIALKGEGVTHLARRALDEYLQENLQDFKLTDEYKIYIEDYLAKKTGNNFLEVGQEVGFSRELIAEAIENAQNLSLSQIENLSQYSRLVSF